MNQVETEYLQALGRNLRGARSRHGYTQEEVARAINMNPRQYGKLEAGLHDSGILKYTRAMQFIGDPISDLFRGLEEGP